MVRELPRIGWRTCLVAAIVALAGWAGPVAAPAAPRLQLGINGDANDSVANDLGIRYVRQSVDWRPIQPREDVWNWDSLDFRVRAAAERRLTLLPVLLGGAPWVDAWYQLPSRPDAYARYVARVAARYGPSGDFWRAHPSLPYRPITWINLWNEPYLTFFSRDGVDPGRYARLVRAAVRAGRRANPRVRYLLEVEKTPGIARQEPRRFFIDDMYAAVPDLNRWFDAVSIHPFSGDRSPTRPNDPWGFERIDAIRARLRAHGAARKPVWITEIGWSTCPAALGCVSELKQAAYYRSVYRLVRRRHRYVRALYFYNDRDRRVGPTTDPSEWFGVVRSDGSRKPAFHVLRAIGRGH